MAESSLITSEPIPEEWVYALSIEDYARLLGDKGKIFHFQATICALPTNRWALNLRYQTRGPSTPSLRLAMGSKMIALPMDCDGDGSPLVLGQVENMGQANGNKSFDATVKVHYRPVGDRMLPYIVAIEPPVSNKKHVSLHACDFSLDFGFHELRCSYAGCEKKLHKRDIERSWVPKI